MSKKFNRRAFVRNSLYAGTALALADAAASYASSKEQDSHLVSQSLDRTADLIAFNGIITTLMPDRPEVAAIAIREGIVTAVGSNEEVLQLQGDATRLVDLGGRRVIPGLNDSHIHAIRGGRFYNLELRWDGVPTLAIALELLREQAERTPPGQWVRVMGGWSPFQFAEKRLPTIAELNAAAPNTPVFVLLLYSRGFLNQAGLEALGIDASTEAPAGGSYELDENGQPTGVLLAEPTPTILYQTISNLPELSAEDQVNSTRYFYRELNRFGVTSVIDAGGGGHEFPEDYTATETIVQSGDLPLRIAYYLVPQERGEEVQIFRRMIENNTVNENEATRLRNGYVLEGGGEILNLAAGDFENFLAVQPMLSDRDGWREGLTAVTRELVSSGWPIRIHATYGESISNILDVFETVDEEYSFSNIRWVIDHAETIFPEDIERVKRLGGGIAIQDRMAYAGEYFIERYGEAAAKQAPPVTSLLQAEIPVGAGTDGTRAASYNPWVSLYWLVSGRTVGGTQLYGAENCLDRTKALELWTVGSAWFSGEDATKGRLALGQIGDFAVLSKDYFSIPEEEIKEVESVMTVVGGEVVYGADAFESLSPQLPAVSPSWSPVAVREGYYQASS